MYCCCCCWKSASCACRSAWDASVAAFWLALGDAAASESVKTSLVSVPELVVSSMMCCSLLGIYTASVNVHPLKPLASWLAHLLYQSSLPSPCEKTENERGNEQLSFETFLILLIG
jgi:hypothetical protein